jgi:hypothetical protein
VQVINSKQRPRKLTIYGSDGHEYQFLLKGHEDLRQDERVMQARAAARAAWLAPACVLLGVANGSCLQLRWAAWCGSTLRRAWQLSSLPFVRSCRSDARLPMYLY